MSKFTKSLKGLLVENNNKVYFDCTGWTKQQKSDLQQDLFKEGWVWAAGGYLQFLDLCYLYIGGDNTLAYAEVGSNYHIAEGYTCINQYYKPMNKENNMKTTKNVHPLPPTTTRVTVEYKNGQTYTFPNCKDVSLSKQSLCGESSSVFEEEGVSVTKKHCFRINIDQLSAINIRGKEDYVSSEILIEEGLVMSITDATDPDGLSKPRDFIVV